MGFENGKLVRVVLQAVGPNQAQQVNVLHYDLQDSSLAEPANDPQQLADTFRDAVVPPFRALYRPEWTIQPVIVEQEKDPQNPTAARQAWTSGTAVTGTRATTGDFMPQAVCGVATLKTDTIGRRHTGRIFLGGSIVEGDQAAGTWDNALLTLWRAFLDAIPKQPDIATGTSDASANWCVYSRTNRAADIDPYASHIASYILRTNVHWLRSREK